MMVDGSVDAVIVACSVFTERVEAAIEHAIGVAQLTVKGLKHLGARLAHDLDPGRKYLRVGQLRISKKVRISVAEPARAI